MTARRHILLTLLALCAFATAAQAQLVFTPDTWDFGTIRETDGRVSHTFTGENRGNTPVVILDVVTTCGCTVPQFTKRPIRPGEKTTVKVTFDPANRPGAFTKELGVYSSERKKVATLTIRGNVTPRMKSTEELYPVDAGGGLRLSTTLNAFSYIRPGQQVQSAIGYANTSGKTIRLELRPLESSGLLTVTAPHRDRTGRTGIDQRCLPHPRGRSPLRHAAPTPSRCAVDGRTNGTAIVTTRHRHRPDANRRRRTKTPRKRRMIENILKFGPVKPGAPRQDGTFTLSDAGPVPNWSCAPSKPTAGSPRRLVPGQRIPAGSSFTGEGLRRPGRTGFRRADRFRDDRHQRPAAPDATAEGNGHHRRITTICGSPPEGGGRKECSNVPDT